MTLAYRNIEARLARALEAGRACHAFFISGADGALSREAAMRAARIVVFGREDAALPLSSSPDYFELEGALVRIERVREIIAELTHRPTGAFGRAIAVWNAHALSRQVQNALLKSIEEPPANTVFLLTGNVDGVLPTIASRCCVMRAGQAGSEAVYERLLLLGAPDAQARLYAQLSCASVARGERLYREEAFRAFRALALDAAAELLRGGLPANAAGKLAQEAGEALCFMLAYLSDALRMKTGGAVRDNPDRADEIKGFLASFTIGKLACMIELLCAANADIVRAGGGRYYAAPAINRLFLDISEVINS